MASFLLLVTLLNRSSADEIDFDGCSQQTSFLLSGGGEIATNFGCAESAKCHRLNGDDGTGLGAGEIERRFDTTGYSDIYAAFDIETTGFGSNEFCWVLYSVDNGVNWIEINKYSSENDGEDRYIYFPPSVNDNYNFKIKFQNNANQEAKYCYIDGVGVYGISPKNIPYDSSIRIFEDYAIPNITDSEWIWTGNNNEGDVDYINYNCLGYIGCDTCSCFQIMGGSRPGSLQKLISTAGYIHITAEFDIRSTGIYGDEHCIAWYTDNGGNNWHEIDALDLTNDGKRYYFLPDSCSDNNQFGLRFSIQASTISDVCYIDMIKINGDLSTASPTNNPSTSPTTPIPTAIPTFLPSQNSSPNPTYSQTKYQTTYPTTDSTPNPSTDPTYIPTMDPTFTYNPTIYPTNTPTIIPTISPISVTKQSTSITMNQNKPNSQISEKTSTTITNIGSNNIDNNDNQRQSLNINININTTIFIIIMVICVIFICFLISICFWCLTKKNKQNDKVEEATLVDMEMNKSDDEINKTLETNELNLVQVASISNATSIDINLLRVQQQQHEALENVTIRGSSSDGNVDEDDEEEEGLNMYTIDAPNNNDDNEIDDDTTNYDDMYLETVIITEGNNVGTPIEPGQYI